MKNLLQALRTTSLVLILSLAAVGQIYNPSNILENGNFTQGFAGYTMGLDQGKYWTFYVSTDAPSGSTYSGEVVCGAAAPVGGCVEGAIATDPIPVDATEEYQLTGSYKCDTNGSGHFQVLTHYESGYTGFVGYVQFTCDSTWHTLPNNSSTNFGPFASHNGQLPFSMELAFYNTSYPQALKIGNLRLTWLVNGQRVVPTQDENDRGSRTVAVMNGGTGVPIPYVKVDGNPYFELGFYNVPPSDYPTLTSNIPAANTALSSNSVATPPNKYFNYGQIPGLNLQDYRDWAYEHDPPLNLGPDSMYTVRPGLDDGTTKHPNGTGAETTLGPAVTEYSPHLANIVWLLSDEDDLESTPSFLISGAELIKLAGIAAQNTDLPLLVNLLCATDTYGPDCGSFSINNYDGAADIWSAEIYNDVPSTYFSLIDGAIGVFNSVQSGIKRPIWLALDADQTSMFPKAYYALIKGATGFSFFDWSDFALDSSLQGSAQTLFSQLSQLQDPVLSGTVAGVTSSPSLPLLARTYTLQGYRTYIVAVNTGSSMTGPVTFQVPGLAGGKTIDVDFGMRQITSSLGQFTDSSGFQAATQHVYRIPQ